MTSPLALLAQALRIGAVGKMVRRPAPVPRAVRPAPAVRRPAPSPTPVRPAALRPSPLTQVASGRTVYVPIVSQPGIPLAPAAGVDTLGVGGLAKGVVSLGVVTGAKLANLPLPAVTGALAGVGLVYGIITHDVGAIASSGFGLAGAAAASAAAAAESAGWSARSAESAAWSAAAYIKYAKELIRLLKEQR